MEEVGNYFGPIHEASAFCRRVGSAVFEKLSFFSVAVCEKKSSTIFEDLYKRIPANEVGKSYIFVEEVLMIDMHFKERSKMHLFLL